jgi:hypothetical protein
MQDAEDMNIAEHEEGRWIQLYGSCDASEGQPRAHGILTISPKAVNHAYNFIIIGPVKYLSRRDSLGANFLLFLLGFKGNLCFHVDHAALDKDPKCLGARMHDSACRFYPANWFRSDRRPKASSALCRL